MLIGWRADQTLSETSFTCSSPMYPKFHLIAIDVLIFCHILLEWSTEPNRFTDRKKFRGFNPYLPLFNDFTSYLFFIYFFQLLLSFRIKNAIAIDTFNNAYLKKGISKAETKSLIKLYRPPQNDEYFQVVTETQGVGINLKPAFEGPKAKPDSWQMKRILESIFKQLKHDTAQCRECSCVPDMVGKGKTVCKTVPCKA